MYEYSQSQYELRERTRRRRLAAEAERARPRWPQGMQELGYQPASRRSPAPSSDSRTGITIDQWRPTGQRWILRKPRRSALTETLGIQSVLKR